MIYSVVVFAILLITSYGQDVCDSLRGLNATRLRQRINQSDGTLIAYSDLSLFLQNGTLIEINLQNASRPERIGRYRIREEKNEETVCILERELIGTENNYTDCETLTITAKSNSAEGAEGCTVGEITNSSQCLKTCRASQAGGLVTDDLVAYIINGKVEEDLLHSEGRGLKLFGKGKGGKKHMDRMDRSSSDSEDEARRGNKSGKGKGKGKGKRGSESGRSLKVGDKSNEPKEPKQGKKDSRDPKAPKGQKQPRGEGKQGKGDEGDKDDKKPKSKGRTGGN